MNSQHRHLIFRAKVRWLPRGRVLARLFDLREEANQFLTGENFLLKELLSDRIWIDKLAYLADTFRRLNDLNSFLRGHFPIFLYCATKLMLSKSIFFWNSCLQKDDMNMFPTLQDFVVNASVDTKELFAIMSQY